MKNLILSLIGLFIFSTPVLGSQKDSLYTIEIDGKVMIPKQDPSRTYKIELLCHNTVVDSGLVVDNESFLLKVKKNSWYTIRIIKDGYFTQTISMDTRVPEYNDNIHKFHFDTELIVENYTSIQDLDAIDFPIAIVSFNPNSDQFVPVREYSKNIKSSLFEEPVMVKNSYAKH
jgi:hypothetical protein